MDESCWDGRRAVSAREVIGDHYVLQPVGSDDQSVAFAKDRVSLPHSGTQPVHGLLGAVALTLPPLPGVHVLMDYNNHLDF